MKAGLTRREGRPTPDLDRIWEATRPDGLSPEAFDRIWADVQRAHDAPTTLAMPGPVARRGRAGRVVLGLAQAAALLVAAWLMARPRPIRDEPGPALVKADPAPRVPDQLGVDEDEIFVVELGQDNGVKYRRLSPETEAGPAIASNGVRWAQIPAFNQSDMLNQMESLAP